MLLYMWEQPKNQKADPCNFLLPRFPTDLWAHDVLAEPKTGTSKNLALNPSRKLLHATKPSCFLLCMGISSLMGLPHTLNNGNRGLQSPWMEHVPHSLFSWPSWSVLPTNKPFPNHVCTFVHWEMLTGLWSGSGNACWRMCPAHKLRGEHDGGFTACRATHHQGQQPSNCQASAYWYLGSFYGLVFL